MIIGTESFSNGMVGIFNTMSMEIRKIWIKMWYEQEIMKPLQNWIYGLFGGGGSGSGGGSFDYKSQYNIDYEGNTTNPISFKPKALGGPVSPGQSYRVGEFSEDLFVPNVAGAIIPHNQVQNLEKESLMGLSKVTVNLINNTGSEAKATATSRFDDFGNAIIQVVMDAIPQNKGGIQDMIAAVGRR